VIVRPCYLADDRLLVVLVKSSPRLAVSVRVGSSCFSFFKFTIRSTSNSASPAHATNSRRIPTHPITGEIPRIPRAHDSSFCTLLPSLTLTPFCHRSLSLSLSLLAQDEFSAIFCETIVDRRQTKRHFNSELRMTLKKQFSR
jgi:hypothetical protein